MSLDCRRNKIGGWRWRNIKAWFSLYDSHRFINIPVDLSALPTKVSSWCANDHRPQFRRAPRNVVERVESFSHTSMSPKMLLLLLFYISHSFSPFSKNISVLISHNFHSRLHVRSFSTLFQYYICLCVWISLFSLQ